MNAQQAVAQLRAVMCDPENRVCVHGSDEDRHLMQEALDYLAEQGQQSIDPDAPVSSYILDECSEWASSRGHGDNCYLSDHYDGDPGNRCNCGLDGLLRDIESAQSQTPPKEQGSGLSDALSELQMQLAKNPNLVVHQVPGESWLRWTVLDSPPNSDVLPVAWQYRRYFGGEEDAGWSAWHECTQEEAESRASKGHPFETRALYESTRAPQPHNEQDTP